MIRDEFKISMSFTLALILAMLMGFAALFSSCGSHRLNMKQETSIESVSNHQRKDTASASQQVKKTEHEDVIETVEEVTTVYDTSLPADSATGKPPVLSETKKTTKRETNKRSQEDKSSSLNQSTSLNDQDRTAIKATGEESKQKEETTVPRQIGGIVWAVAAFVIVVIVWRIIKSKIK